MYMSGIRVDRTALQQVRLEFEKEKAEIEDRLQRKTRDLMGDTPINLNSPEQASQVIFSRRVYTTRKNGLTCLITLRHSKSLEMQ